MQFEGYNEWLLELEKLAIEEQIAAEEDCEVERD